VKVPELWMDCGILNQQPRSHTEAFYMKPRLIEGMFLRGQKDEPCDQIENARSQHSFKKKTVWNECHLVMQPTLFMLAALLSSNIHSRQRSLAAPSQGMASSML